MINNVLILDTETTGLSPDKGAVTIEIGALLFNVKHRVVTQTLSTFLPCLNNPVEHINNIKAEWTHSPVGQHWLSMLLSMAEVADCVMAHNAPFDKRFIDKLLPTDPAWDSLTKHLRDKLWLCSKDDFPWPPNNTGGKKLENLCQLMGVPYVNAHRALADCQFMVDCFSKMPDIQQKLNYAREIKIRK